MHHWSGKHPPLYENVDSRKSVELASSRNLLDWERVASRAPFLELSPVSHGETYDTGQILLTNRPVRRNNELWFYYLGIRYRFLLTEEVLNRRYLDSVALCLARLRMDGFVSLKGGVEWGSVLTRPLVVSGESLRINTDSWRGRVLTEVIDASNGQPIAGFTKEDCIAAIITASTSAFNGAIVAICPNCPARPSGCASMCGRRNCTHTGSNKRGATLTLTGANAARRRDKPGYVPPHEGNENGAAT